MEKELKYFTVEKALAFEHLLKETERGKTENKSFFKCSDIDAREDMFRQERNEAILVLRQKQMENHTLQTEFQHLHSKDLRLKQEQERVHDGLWKQKHLLTARLWLQRTERLN